MTLTRLLAMVLGHLTHPGLGLDHVEERGDAPPDQGGQGQPGEVVLYNCHSAATVGAAREINKV